MSASLIARSRDHTFYNASQAMSVLEYDFSSNDIPGEVVIGPVWFEGFTNFPGAQWIFQVNMRNTTENALNEAREVIKYAAENLYAFEIGNEPDIAVMEGEATSYSQSDYVKKWLAIADAITHNVLKGNPYGLDETRLFQVLTYAGHDLDGFSV